METPADPAPRNNMMHGPLPKVQFRCATAQLRARVGWDAETGVEGYPRPAATSARAPVPAAGGTTPVTCGGEASAGLSGDLFLAPAVAAADSLPALREAIGDCRRCKLAPHRTNIVFGVGDPRAALMFVGEGPGHDEDVQGEPFVGRAGQLLTEIITKGMRLRREDVYIANVVKCRPPGNRNPEPDEVAACRPFLERQIEIIRPRIIVALGTFAAQMLLGTRTPITRLRGHWHDYHGTRLMPTFHPAYLLRNPHDKRLVWDDIKAVMRELGLQPEAR
jgi:DNA polymerase